MTAKRLGKTSYNGYKTQSFEKSLLRYFEESGYNIYAQYRIHQDTVVDIYIAAPVRAFIEIKQVRSHGSLPSSFKVELMSRLKHVFSDSILGIFILITHKKNDIDHLKRSLKSNYLFEAVFFDEVNKDPDLVAKECVNTIVKRIASGDYPQDKTNKINYEYIDTTHPKIAKQWHQNKNGELTPDLVTKDSNKKVWWICKDGHEWEAVISNRTKGTNCPYCSNKKVWRGERGSKKRKIAPPLSKEKDKSFDKQALAKNNFFPGVVEPFKTVIPDKNYKVLKHELSYISQEYSAGHFSAVAVRCGRALEHILYSLAEAWNVDINKKTLRAIQTMKNLLSEIEQKLIEISSSEDEVEEQEHLTEELKRKVNSLNSYLNDLLLDVGIREASLADKEVIINPNSLLRDIFQKYRRNEKVRKELKSLKEGDLITDIGNIRNNAAHASLDGSFREAGREDADKINEDLKSVMVKLSNIASFISHEV